MGAKPLATLSWTHRNWARSSNWRRSACISRFARTGWAEFSEHVANGFVQKSALDAYHSAFEPSPFCTKPYAGIGLVVLAADTEGEAERLAAPLKAWALARGTGTFAPYLSAEDAAAYLAQAPLEAPERGIIGSAQSVAQRLSETAAECRADELFLLSITDQIETRINSYRQIETAIMALNAETA